MIQRYNCIADGYSMDPSDDGEYVRFDAIVELRTQLADMAHEVEQLHQQLATVNEVSENAHRLYHETREQLVTAEADRDKWRESCHNATSQLGDNRTRAERAEEALAAEYKVRKHIIRALEGQGLPKVMPDKGYGVIEDAHNLFNRAFNAEQAHRLACEIIAAQGERIKQITGERDKFKKQLMKYLPFSF